MTYYFSQGLPGSPGNSGPPGKEGPAVSNFQIFKFHCSTQIALTLCLNYHIRSNEHH